MGEIYKENGEVVVEKRHEAQRHVVIGINWCFPRPFIAKRKRGPSFKKVPIRPTMLTPNPCLLIHLPTTPFPNDSLAGRESETYGNRIHTCLITSPAGRPLHSYKSVRELLEAFRDAIAGHRSQWGYICWLRDRIVLSGDRMTRSCWTQLGKAEEVTIKVNVTISHHYLPITEWIMFELRQEFWIATFEFGEGIQGLASITRRSACNSHLVLLFVIYQETTN